MRTRRHFELTDVERAAAPPDTVDLAHDCRADVDLRHLLGGQRRAGIEPLSACRREQQRRDHGAAHGGTSTHRAALYTIRPPLPSTS